MSKHLTEFLTYRALAYKFDGDGSALLEHAIESAQGDDVPVRNMCAKVHPHLIERLEAVCELMDVSKRRFIEVAVSSAIHEAEELLAQHGEESFK